MAYVILAHLLSLGSYIIGFNLLEGLYVKVVKDSLIGFMAEIALILVKSSKYLHDLMNILILHFCAIINYIFAIIKAKLLFYLEVLKFQIDIDMLQLSVDLLSMKSLLLHLQSHLGKYILISQSVNQLLKALSTLLPRIRLLRSLVSIIDFFIKLISKLLCKFKSISSSCNNLNGISCCLQTEKSSESVKGIKLPENIIDIIRNMSRNNVKVSIGNIDLSLIVKLYDIYNIIKNISDMIDINDREVSKEIMSIVGQLFIVETINLVKLYELITQMQMLYLKILVRGNLLKCTIEYYQKINPTITSLCKSLKFDCCNCREFLTTCCKVEEYIKSVSSKINECIEKLRQACKNNERCGAPKELKELFDTIIKVISNLKFYVDLIARKILIFKTIIMNLIVMRVSSAILDVLMLYIVTNIKKVEDAIKNLNYVLECFRAFYVIQLENTIVIFGLSSALKFSQSIHKHYKVLLLNLQSIQILIWVIECYIHHLIVFKHVSTNLNLLSDQIVGLGDIIVQIFNVVKAMDRITKKLKIIDKSTKELNDIQGSMDITKWKQTAQGIRDQIKSINTNVNHIESEISQMSVHVKSILLSWATLISLEYFLKALISYVYNEFKRTNNRYSVAMGMGNQYYGGVIMSVLEPCNKQLNFILAYLLLMLGVMENLIKIVHTSVGLIIVKIGWLYGLNKILQKRINEIDRGVVEVECAIEGVARNFIRCSTIPQNTCYNW